ncbi:MAG: transcription elongation factor GreA [Candidatus Omnitrophota bacterium]
MPQDNYLTREGFNKLMQELEYLKTTKRREISKEIAKARAFGDLKENAEYDAAKNEQGLNEKKIAELEFKLSQASIIDDTNIEKDKVLIGAKVKLLDLDTQEECEYIFVSELEADYAQNKISITSPIGRGLLGHKKGEVVEIKIPAGILKYKILSICR